jgi:hypothetical protein
MATKQIDGVTDVTKTSTVNNGGSAVNIGSTSSVLSNSTLGYKGVGVFGSTVIDGTNTNKALTAGSFAYSNQRPVGKKVSSKVAGVTNTVLESGAAQPGLVKSVHKSSVKNGSGNIVDGVRTRRFTTAIRSGSFNIYTGQFSSAPTVAADTFASDNAANVSRSNTGKLVYKAGAKVPTSVSYASKTA